MMKDDVQNEMNKKRRQAILNGHPYKIWQSKGGRWWTHVPDPGKKDGRKKVVKTHLEDLHDYLYSFYAGGFEGREEEPPTLASLYPEWLDFKSLHTEASTSISRLNCDWNTRLISGCIDFPKTRTNTHSPGFAAKEKHRFNPQKSNRCLRAPSGTRRMITPEISHE